LKSKSNESTIIENDDRPKNRKTFA
jgi:hypothetical protein